jgi:chromosome segregation ATPase
VDEGFDGEPSCVSGADGEWGHGADRTIVVHATPSSVRDSPQPSDSHAEIEGIISDLQDENVDLRKAIEANGRAKQAATWKIKEVVDQVGLAERLLASRVAKSIEQHSKVLDHLQAAMNRQDSRLQSLEALEQRLRRLEGNVETLSSKQNAEHEAQNAMQRTIEGQKAEIENLNWHFGALRQALVGDMGDKEVHPGGDKGSQAAEYQG